MQSLRIQSISRKCWFSPASSLHFYCHLDSSRMLSAPGCLCLLLLLHAIILFTAIRACCGNATEFGRKLLSVQSQICWWCKFFSLVLQFPRRKKKLKAFYRLQSIFSLNLLQSLITIVRPWAQWGLNLGTVPHCKAMDQRTIEKWARLAF